MCCFRWYTMPASSRSRAALIFRGCLRRHLRMKLIQRHPHVFADVQVDGTEQVLNNWEQIKQQSKGQTTGAQTLLSVPKTFPALMRAQKVQKRAAKTGFEYPDLFWAMDDLESELDELQAAIDEEDPQQCLMSRDVLVFLQEYF